MAADGRTESRNAIQNQYSLAGIEFDARRSPCVI
jgi:hypothetical protein